jgi:hypothetical protein
MFNVYIDDSGTAPDQRIALASALIIPTKRIMALEEEWATFRKKYSISEFHTSECVYRNSKSEFASWDDIRVANALARVRQITMKYAVRAPSFAVTKAEFDKIMPDVWRQFIGTSHYVWAIWMLLKIIRQWSDAYDSRSQMEFVFDHMQGKPRDQVQEALSQMETLYPGVYEGHYSFRKRRDWGALQCTDLLAWSNFGAARLRFEQTPIHPLAEQTIKEFRRFRNGEWISGNALKEKDLMLAVEKHLHPLL